MVLYATHVGEEFWCLCTSDGTELFSVLVVSQYVFLGLYKNTIRIWPKLSFRFHFPLVPEKNPPIIYFTQVLFHQILSTGFLFVNWTSSPLLLLSSLWTWHHMQKIPMISVCLGCRRPKCFWITRYFLWYCRRFFFSRKTCPASDLQDLSVVFIDENGHRMWTTRRIKLDYPESSWYAQSLSCIIIAFHP